ncbi:GDSL-like lipase/acylhydrolase, putative [Verrucomicrobiia bacterium DG1235]|nr:GDSL-like lipase/acylhydrolase, putative [Verrucomicrobiae bacterium DG1235]
MIALLALLFATNLLASSESSKRILFLGDSLTAGYGINPQFAYPNRIAKKIETLGLDYSVTPAGLSGETSAGGLRRANWVMQKPVSILVIALGANDGLRGIDLSDTRKNLQGIIDLARKKYPEVKIVLAGMQMPPNLGEDYTKEFRTMYPSLAEANQAALIPFLLEGVGGNPELNIADGIHPNPDGHAIVAETVWKVLEPLLTK